MKRGYQIILMLMMAIILTMPPVNVEAITSTNQSTLLFSKKVSVTSVKLNKTSSTLKKGKKLTLKATVSPSKATNKKVTWKSSNIKVATVSSKGVVTAKAPGKSTITVTTSNGKKATCEITVPYTVTYKLNGGSNHKSNPSTYYGKKVTLKNPTRKGYTFKGWYSDSKCTKKVLSFSSGNKILYAKWSKTTSSNAKTSNVSNTVYITNTGNKYHANGCSYLKKSKTPISKSKAKSRGYTPCSKCKP